MFLLPRTFDNGTCLSLIVCGLFSPIVRFVGMPDTFRCFPYPFARLLCSVFCFDIDFFVVLAYIIGTKQYLKRITFGGIEQ